MKWQRAKGSITVFLSLLLPFLLAFICTLLEIARFQSSKTLLTEHNAQSMQMLFSDYNKELWEDYHLFAYTGEETEAEKEINRAIVAALGGEETENAIWKRNYLDIWHIKLQKISLESKEMLTDEDGELLKHEAVEFMKYQMTEDTIKKILKFFGVVKETGAAAKVSQKKLKTEKKLYDYSKEMLGFIECIDGIDFGENGIQYVGKKVKVKSSFVKQFFYGVADKAEAGIDNEFVWRSLKAHYYHSKEDLESLKALLKEMQQAVDSLEKDQNQLTILKEKLEHLRREEQLILKLDKSNKDKGDDKDEEAHKNKENNKAQLLENHKSQSDIEDQINYLYKKVKNAENIKNNFLSSWQKKSRQITKKIEQIKHCADDAIMMIPKLETLQKSAKTAVQDYQKTLKQEKTEISEEMYQSFYDDYEELASSVGVKDREKKQDVCDLNAFRSYLQENIDILKNIQSSIVWNGKSFELEVLKQKELELLNAIEQAEKYHVSEFIFHYQVSEKREQKNPMETLKKLGKLSVLSLVVKDEKKISGNTIEKREKVFSNEEKEKFLESMNDKLIGISIESQDTLSSIFGEFSSVISENISSSDINIGKVLLQNLCLNGYVQNVCNHYVTEKEDEKVSALRYEEEYLLSGHDIDKENLASVVKKIIALRTICNYLSLLSDSARQKEAYAAAAVIAGFTGIEPFTEVLKSAILLVWAYEESFIDTAALLQGKKLSLIKTPSQLTLSFKELLTFGKTMIQSKAGKISEDKSGCSYSEYLSLFLYIQKQKILLYRMADIIQMNMQERYDQTFLLDKALFGCRMKGNYYVPTVFTRFPWVHWMIDGEADGWNLEIISEKAY